MGFFLPDIRVDQVLTNISLSYTQADLVGDRILPVIPVGARSARYVVYGREQFRRRDDLRRPGASAMEVRRTLSFDQYNAEEHAQKELVTAAEERYATAPISPRVDATEFLTQQVQNAREYRQISVVTDPTQVTQNLGLSGTSQWSDYANSVPLTNIKNARIAVRAGVIQEANMLTVPFEVALTLADHPSIKDLLRFTDPQNLAAAGLPPTIRGLMVNVARSMIDTSNEGQAPVLSTIFGKNALVHFSNPNPGPKSISFGYTMEAPDDLSGVRGYYTRTWFDEDKKGTWVETAVTYDIKLFAPLGAYLFTTAIA